jgi:hypothetical protein
MFRYVSSFGECLMEDGGSFIVMCVKSGDASEMWGGHVGWLRVPLEEVVPHILSLLGDPE